MKKTNIFLISLIIISAIVLFNQYQISSISKGLDTSITDSVIKSSRDINLDNVDIFDLKSTAHSVKALFPVDKIKTTQDAIDIMIPTGTPNYKELGISYDDPIKGLSKLVNVYRAIKLSPEIEQRYVNLVTKPVGISCEYCCGIGMIGTNAKGESTCGCQHNPALLGLTKWLMQNTDYSDAEILKEAIKWKTLFFPKNMVELAMQVSGTSFSDLEIPSMVGGC